MITYVKLSLNYAFNLHEYVGNYKISFFFLMNKDKLIGIIEWMTYRITFIPSYTLIIMYTKLD